MIKHIVMWKLKDNAEGKPKLENAKWIKKSLEGLLGIVKEIKSMEVGVNISKSDMAFDAVLISEFETLEDLEAYRSNPAHVKISQYIKKVKDDRVVVDFEF